MCSDKLRQTEKDIDLEFRNLFGMLLYFTSTDL